MKKCFFVFLLSKLCVLMSLGFALGDYYGEVQGTIKNVERQTSGPTAGNCEGKEELEKCESAGATVAQCEYIDKKKTKLSCTAKECKSGYLLHIGYGICRSTKAAENFCKTKTNCENTETPIPMVMDNPKKDKKNIPFKGSAFEKCFCAGKNIIEYSCGDGAVGTPPTDSNEYKNIDNIVIANNTCTKAGAIFKNWKCGNNNIAEGANLKITGKTTCVAQWASCEKCKPGPGCTCEIQVQDNQCKYITGVEDGYIEKSNHGTPTPQCILANEKDCTDSGGVYENGKCKCKEGTENAHWDIKDKKCICDDSDKVIKENKCILPCPDGTTGTHPQCVCNDESLQWDGHGCVSKQILSSANVSAPGIDTNTNINVQAQDNENDAKFIADVNKFIAAFRNKDLCKEQEPDNDES